MRVHDEYQAFFPPDVTFVEVLGALADHAFGQREKAIDSLRHVVASAPNHLAAGLILDWIEHELKLAAILPEVHPIS